MKPAEKKIMTPLEWEAEAVDFMPVELDKMFHVDILAYAEAAQTFILKTMQQMEVRPRRSFIRRLKEKK